MEIDTTALKRALFDLFKFNPKDFYVQGSATGYLVGLNSRKSSSSGGGGGGSVTSQIRVNQTISSTEQTYSSGAQASTAAAFALTTAQKATVDASVTSNFNTAIAAQVWGDGILLSNSFPIDLAVSYKQITLTLNSGPTYTAGLKERRFENYLFLQKNGAITRFTVFYSIVLRTTIGATGVPTESTLTTGSFDAPISPLVSAYSIQFTKALSYPDIAARAWPADPATPVVAGVTESNTIELVYRITNITPV